METVVVASPPHRETAVENIGIRSYKCFYNSFYNSTLDKGNIYS